MQDGYRLVSGSVDSTLCVWDSITGVCVAMLEGHTDAVEVQLCSPPPLADAIEVGLCSPPPITDAVEVQLCSPP